MTNIEAAAMFIELADLLDLAGELPFKSASYRKVARSLGELSEPFGQIISAGNFHQIDGAGKAIREKLTAMALTGKLPALEKWRQHKAAGFYEALKRYQVKPRPLGALIKKCEARDIKDLLEKIDKHGIDSFTGQMRETAIKIKEVEDND